MKRIIYSLSLIALTLMSCTDYNESNFPGYDDANTPTYVASYNYTLASSDYTSIGDGIKKPYTDSITIYNTLLKTANKADSAKYNALILKLKSDSTYLAGNSISTNKIFLNATQASKYIISFLNTKYIYGDNNSAAKVNFNLSYDTTKIAAANKYTLVTTDYDAMGTTAATPGQYDNFSVTIDANYYLPIFLKKTYPYAVKGDMKLLRYKYFASSVTSQVTTIFIYDGTNWVNYNTTSQTSKSFVYRNKTWLDLLIYKGLTSGFGDFTTYSVAGAQAWTWDNTYGAKMTGYSSGYIDNEDWLISPSMDLSNRSKATLSFAHTGKYFSTSTGTVTKSTDATLWVSENYTPGNNPTSATWTKVEIPTYWTTDWTFITCKVNLTAYAGKKINFAFKYLSSSSSSVAGTWELNNVSLTEE